MGKGEGERGDERMRAEERAVEGRGGEGLAGGSGGEWKERPDRWSAGKPAGRGLWEGSGCGGGTATLLSLSLHTHPQCCSPRPRALWGSPATPTPGCPSWSSHGGARAVPFGVSPTQGCAGHQARRARGGGVPRQRSPALG